MEPLTASTNTTRPTSATTYLANRPSRRNPILFLTPIILPLGHIHNELPRRHSFGWLPRQYGHPGQSVLAQIEGVLPGMPAWFSGSCLRLPDTTAPLGPGPRCCARQAFASPRHDGSRMSLG